MRYLDGCQSIHLVVCSVVITIYAFLAVHFRTEKLREALILVIVLGHGPPFVMLDLAAVKLSTKSLRALPNSVQSQKLRSKIKNFRSECAYAGVSFSAIAGGSFTCLFYPHYMSTTIGWVSVRAHNDLDNT